MKTLAKTCVRLKRVCINYDWNHSDILQLVQKCPLNLRERRRRSPDFPSVLWTVDGRSTIYNYVYVPLTCIQTQMHSTLWDCRIMFTKDLSMYSCYWLINGNVSIRWRHHELVHPVTLLLPWQFTPFQNLYAFPSDRHLIMIDLGIVSNKSFR